MNESVQQVYLREDVYFEPLLRNWYAWPYLLPPVCTALNFMGRNLRLMKSFVNNHRIHIAARSQPGLAGGDFVDCSEEQVEDVRRLVEDIESHDVYRRIRDAVAELNELLAKETGHSLERLYEQVPEVLRGYVELVYDGGHNATFRLIEGLIYESPLYDESIQSISLGMLERVERRPFVLSSPRFPDQNHLHLDVPLSSPSLDELFAARTRPVSMDRMRKLFADCQQQGGVGFDELFTATPPQRGYEPLQSSLRIRFTGHAGLLLETPHVAIMVDPVIASVDKRYVETDIVSFAQLPDRIDYVCLTHTHMDHVCVETLIQLRHKIGCVLVPKNSGGNLFDPSVKLMLQKIGLIVREFEDMETLRLDDGYIRAIPFLGEHADLNIRSKTAWYFELAGKKIFSGADSASVDAIMYERIHRLIGKLDLLFIGMECVGAPLSWMYGPLFIKPIPRAINESRRLNGSDFDSARKLVEIFAPNEVYIYALGMEPWFRYFMGLDYHENSRQVQESERLLAFCAERGLHAERLVGSRRWEL
ncbi:MBL fold metallo-hydrolase [Dyella sp.]|uniref:MBL fold metallo-hydrolase n=1 Tax=Dyella sp. TaxID=1869338 RepID=UPI002B49C58B|nr:MBL fold metallo-hydrolase [Dyella sp.]HKT30252.1 MBL fold metallo-hydrolase [Dyella sp.]